MIAVPAIARNAKNHTGQYLKPVLARKAKGGAQGSGIGPRNGLVAGIIRFPAKADPCGPA